MDQSTKQDWVEPKLSRLHAGSAENAPPGELPDGSSGGTTRNQFLS